MSVTDPSDLELKLVNETDLSKSCSVGCRQNNDILYTEEIVLEPNETISLFDLPNPGFELGIRTEDGIVGGDQYDNRTDVSLITASITDTGIDITNRRSNQDHVDLVNDPQPQQPAQNQPQQPAQNQPQQPAQNQPQQPAQNQPQQPAQNQPQQPAQNQPQQPAQNQPQQPAQNQPQQPAQNQPQQPAQNQPQQPQYNNANARSGNAVITNPNVFESQSLGVQAIFSIITLSTYNLWWCYKTGKMLNKGTNKDTSPVLAFLFVPVLWWQISKAGQAVSDFNPIVGFLFPIVMWYNVQTGMNNIANNR